MVTLFVFASHVGILCSNSHCYYYNNINSENNHVSLGLAQWEVYSVKWNDEKNKNYTITPQTNLSTWKRVGREGKENYFTILRIKFILIIIYNI